MANAGRKKGHTVSHLTKVKDIQDITRQFHGGDGVPYITIWRNIIADKFYISYGHYRSLLAINVKAELRKLGRDDLADKKEKYTQLSLF